MKVDETVLVYMYKEIIHRAGAKRMIVGSTVVQWWF